MRKEFFQKCKDCPDEFGYSDYALQSDLKKGLSKPERCPDCREQHAEEIKSVSNPHFELIPRKGKRLILGMPYLGRIGHGKREIRKRPYQPDTSGMDFGLKDEHIEMIYQALKDYQVLVIVAPTGTGKSTLIPVRLIYPLVGYEIDYFTKNGPIIITQPRIPATSGTAWAITEKMLGSSVGPGFEVGYRHGDKSGRRLGEQYDHYNRLIPVTDGSLLNWITEGKIGTYSIVIIDEAHERSKNIDLILALIKNELLKYPHLKLIIASATIDANKFVTYYGEIIKTKLLDFSDCQKTYGYDEEPWKWSDLINEEIAFEQNEKINMAGEQSLKEYKKDVMQKVANKVLDILKNTKEGGILGFLHGKKEIEDCVEQIRKAIGYRKDIKLFPLYTELGKEKIDKACAEFKESDKVKVDGERILPRRVVIATNIAETSLTIKDIAYVIDSGLIKQSEWNPITCRQELRTRFHSKDGCKQRWGRAGRVQKGYVYKLYSKEQFIKYFPRHTSPEIERECLDDVILKAKASGVEDIDPSRFSWLQEPSRQELDRAIRVFNERRLVDKDNDLTEHGREVYRLANRIGRFLDKYDPNSTNRALDVATLLIKADKYACLIEAITALVMMPHMGTSLYVDEEKKKESSGSYEGLLLWNRKWDLPSKDYIGRLQKELQIGCVDDLEFAYKLFAMYEGKINGISADWEKRYFINIDNFDLIDKAREEIIEIFTQGKKANLIRPLDFSLVERVRLLMAFCWPDRIVEIKQEEQIIFENPKTKIKGVLSENSTGNWYKESRAIIGMMDQSEIIIDGNKKGAPVATFVIKTPNKILSPDTSETEVILEIIKIRKEFDLQQKNYILFAHLFAPAGSIINLTSGSNKFKSSGVVLPILFKPAIDETISFIEEDFDSLKLYDHDIKKNRSAKVYEKHRYRRFEKENIAINTTFEFKFPILKNHEKAIVEHWEYMEGKPVAILSGNEGQIITKQIDLPTGEDKMELKFKRSIFDMLQHKVVGFIGEDKNSHLIPISSMNLSIEQNNPGLKKLEGARFALRYFKTDNLPYTFGLTLLPGLENDLKELTKREIVDAVVEKITTEKIYFSILGKNDFIHSTDLSIGMSMVSEILDKLPLGEKVRLAIKSRFSKDEVLSIDIEENKRLGDFKILKPYDIIVEGNKLSTKRPLQFVDLLRLQTQLPHLIGELRGLYSISNHLTTSGIEITKIYEELKKDVVKLRKEATTKGEPIRENIRKYQEKVKEYERMLLRSSKEELRQLANEAWQLSDLPYLKTRLQKQKTYLIKVEGQIATARTYDFKIQRENKKQEVLQDIAQIEMQIRNIEHLL